MSVQQLKSLRNNLIVILLLMTSCTAFTAIRIDDKILFLCNLHATISLTLLVFKVQKLIKKEKQDQAIERLHIRLMITDQPPAIETPREYKRWVAYPECRQCRYCTNNPSIMCAVNTYGNIEGKVSCDDFAPKELGNNE